MNERLEKLRKKVAVAKEEFDRNQAIIKVASDELEVAMGEAKEAGYDSASALKEKIESNSKLMKEKLDKLEELLGDAA